MSIESLVDTYFDQIKVEDSNYVSWQNAQHDLAYVLLRVPKAMLRGFLQT